MFREKPIAWRQEYQAHPAQTGSASHLVTASYVGHERTVPSLEYRRGSKLLELFYRWIISGYIYRGYREGLRMNIRETSLPQ